MSHENDAVLPYSLMEDGDTIDTPYLYICYALLHFRAAGILYLWGSLLSWHTLSGLPVGTSCLDFF